MSAVDEQLADLFQRVEALEGRPTEDTISPNAFSIDSKGKVRESVGTLILPAATTIEAPGLQVDSEVVWEDENGEPQSGIVGYKLAGDVDSISVRTGGVNPAAELRVESFPTGPTGQALAFAGVEFALILDNLRRSSFPQLNVVADVRISFGVSQVTFPGESEASEPTTINAPEDSTSALYFPVAIEEYGNARFAVVVNASAISAQIFLQSTVGTPPAGTKESFYWLAVGVKERG
jgi:hypothetical protein